MVRLLLIMALFASPLPAVSPEFTTRVDHDLRVESAAVRAHLDEGLRAEITVTFTIINHVDELDAAGELSFELVLPADVIPGDQREDFAITSPDRELPPTRLVDGEFRCGVTLAENQRLTVTWSWSTATTRLPHEHPLGRRMFRVPLQYVKAFTELPGRLDAEITYSGLPDELFGLDEPPEGNAINAGVSVEGKFKNFEFRFLDGTLRAKRDELAARLDEFSEEQRTPENQSYTEMLALLSELHELAGDHTAYADACARLAALEQEAGRAISHCGPWARWRKYVPWVLRRAGANKAAGREVDAASAKAAVTDCWAAYLAARDKRRPFDHFDAAKYGAYWDYDWDRTRELYAEILDLLGEEDAAARVRETGDSDE